MRSVVALLRLMLGPNAAVDHLGDLMHTPAVSKVTSFGHAIPMPTWYGPPNLSDEALGTLASLHAPLDQLTEADRNRVELSLQWLFKAQASHGVDGFLMYWFTLEALAMGGSTKLTLTTLTEISPVLLTEIPHL